MNSWEKLFNSSAHSGVYQAELKVEDTSIRKTAQVNGLEFIYIDLKRISSKRGLLNRVAKALNFPSYFGATWDSLDESLRDLSWKPAAGYVIMLADTRFMAYKAPADFELLRRVLDSAVEFWMKQKVPFFVILADPSKTRIKRK